ncbi:hydrolase [Lactobacillus mulieris]|uniref:Hydrolase n=1 Tax=Lactobacillus mulieris TaxID=2508708 RepID=A0AAW5WZQ3_9LACO|nr:hydrolase [Lactobacillus mulieris]MCZ3622875.1 hydrolase [Lactobacillus mulieris]MCZ3624555.1 hydrolase [Lactobacillus mulieris]MCZ3636880.1 hydrolase [Lactobacillus mulieris]MCZ3690208.1 hydrolase [Lactobacillus mulieris]MCZ3696841.1 hydrolase [Lactobacillus mulieris]
MAISLLIVNFIEVNPTQAASEKTNYNVSTSLVNDTIKPVKMRAKLIKERQKAAIAELTKNAQAEQAKMDAQAKAEAEAKAQEEQKQAQQAVTQAPTPTANTTSQANTQNISGVNKGTFKLSFYDPAALGSNMGYGGVAANLSVFPKGTRLKITLSDGTVWYRVVNDTGGFAAANPNQLDVAMPNSQVPAAGILYATVEVIG